jgi:hypothetical protein
MSCNILLRNGVAFEHRRGRVGREGVPRIRIDFACWIQFVRLLESSECFAEVFPVLAVDLARREMISIEKRFRFGYESGVIPLWTGRVNRVRRQVRVRPRLGVCISA